MSLIFSKWCDALHSKDIDAIMELYDDQAVLLPTFSNKLCFGLESIRSYFLNFMDKNNNNDPTFTIGLKSLSAIIQQSINVAIAFNMVL